MPLLGFEPAILLLKRPVTLELSWPAKLLNRNTVRCDIHYADILGLCFETVHAVIDIK